MMGKKQLEGFLKAFSNDKSKEIILYDPKNRNQIVSELNKKQQELLEDLKHVYNWQHSHAWDLFYYLVDKNTQMFDEKTIFNFMTMSEEESLVVQIVFSQWVLLREDK
ncbi:hypothetical protein [Enterococcus sp. AZ083]|uniref:hypothetical protein n=1 Tax=Enterococcus sp. AZ083 TaxID=2774750 RepID=UPI003D27FC52